MLENTLEGKSGDRLPRKLFERSLNNLETHFGKIEFSNFISATLRFTESDSLVTISCRLTTSCSHWWSKWPLTMLLLKIWEQIGPTSTFTKGPLVKENTDQHKKYVKVVGEVSFSNHKHRQLPDSGNQSSPQVPINLIILSICSFKRDLQLWWDWRSKLLRIFL